MVLIGIDYVSICSYNYQTETFRPAITVENPSGKVGTYLNFSTLCRLDLTSFALFIGERNKIEAFKLKFALDDSAHGKDSRDSHHDQNSVRSIELIHNISKEPRTSALSNNAFLHGFAQAVKKRLLSSHFLSKIGSKPVAIIPKQTSMISELKSPVLQDANQDAQGPEYFMKLYEPSSPIHARRKVSLVPSDHNLIGIARKRSNTYKIKVQTENDFIKEEGYSDQHSHHSSFQARSPKNARKTVPASIHSDESLIRPRSPPRKRLNAFTLYEVNE